MPPTHAPTLRHLPALLLLLLAGRTRSLPSPSTPTTSSAAPRPNILLIVADDLGYADVDFQPNNRSVVRSPHLRRLAYDGVRLSNHHVQPFCSPTRATLLTGRHVLRYGLQNTVIWPQDAWAVPENETLLPEYLRAAGYRTAQIGKWHLGLYKPFALPLARGFDEQYGYYLGGEDYWTHSRSDGLDWHRNDTLETGDNGTYSADLLGDAAVDFIRRGAPPAAASLASAGSAPSSAPAAASAASAATRPWFLYLPFQSVHSPLEAPAASLALYPHLSGPQKTRAAMVSALDDQIGKITDELERTHQLDTTAIVFTSDNGAPDGQALDMTIGSDILDIPGRWADPITGKRPTRPPPGAGSPPHGGGGGSNWPLSGWKHWVFEGGVRSAAFLRYPPVTAAVNGTTHDGLFHSVDWLPTLLKIAGVANPGDGEEEDEDKDKDEERHRSLTTKPALPLDGVDISAALAKGGKVSPRTEIPIQITACGVTKGKVWPRSIVDGPQAALISGDLKLIVDCYWRDSKDVGGSHVQLYNITADVAEMKDLAAARPDDVARLVKRLDYWESVSVEPYNMHIDASCGEGKPQGTNPPRWDHWC